MPRVKRGRFHQTKRKRLLRKTKGYKWGRKSRPKLAKVAVLKAGAYAYRDRRTRKRSFRGLWLVKLNAALREHGWRYAPFMHALKSAGMVLDRKVLADIAEHHPKIFEALLHSVR